MSDQRSLSKTQGASGPGSFPTTRWSDLARAHDADTAVRRAALDQLLSRYLLPMQGHVRARLRLDAEAAEEVVQAFIVNKVLERDLLARADPGKGRFRNYLLTSLDRFVANAARDRRRRQGTPLHELPDVPANGTPTPQEQFDAAWAREVLCQAIGRMRDECERNRRADVWRVFEGRVIGPGPVAGEPVSYDRLAADLRLRSAEEGSNLLVTAKRMFRRSLREVVAEYEPDDREIDEEIVALRSALSRGGCTSE